MGRQSNIGAVNQKFLNRVKPEFSSWGLIEHPNPKSSFGRNDHGYGYDFADLKNASDVKIAAFHILSPGPQLWIKGLRTTKPDDASEIPVIYDNIAGVFTLTRGWSILRPLNIRFEFHTKNRAEPADVAAVRLIDNVIKELPKLRSYLYGKR